MAIMNRRSWQASYVYIFSPCFPSSTTKMIIYFCSFSLEGCKLFTEGQCTHEQIPCRSTLLEHTSDPSAKGVCWTPQEIRFLVPFVPSLIFRFGSLAYISERELGEKRVSTALRGLECIRRRSSATIHRWQDSVGSVLDG